MIKLVAVVATVLSTSFLCSVLEAVLLSLTHSHVALLRERGERAGEYLHRMQQRIDEPIAAILTLNTIANTAGGAVSGAVALEVFGDPWVAAFSAVLTFMVLVFSEIIPKTIGATFWKQLSRPAAYLLRIMIFVMKPIIIPLQLSSRLIGARASGMPTVSRAELEVLAAIGAREGTLDEDEWRVVTSIMNLDRVLVGEVMTPRTDMVAVSVDAQVEEAKALMLEEGHLRLPVYEGDLDRIIGILLARDLWKADQEGSASIRESVRPPDFAPASKKVEDLIGEMREKRTKMVIVLDEFGGTAGLVTLEDLLEEIVGEIQDEHELDEPESFQDLVDGTFRIWGGVPLRDTNQRLGLGLPEDRHDTIGGFIFGELGRLGRVGDLVKVPDGSFRVERMRGRRIEYLRFFRSEESQEAGE
jgi:putative hemolysin